MDLLRDLVGTDKSQLEKDKRIKKAKNDFGFFCRYYLSDYFFEDAAEYQKLLYEVANTRSVSDDLAEKIKPFVKKKYQHLFKPTKNLAGAMFIEPREHGKTVRWSFAYVLWCILTERSRYVLLIGATNEMAKENLENIKMEIEENENLLEDFGELKGSVWTNTKLVLSNKTRIQAKGAGASMRGTRYRQYRPDLIVLDDVLKDKDAESPEQRNKIHKWLKRVVFNLGKKAFIIWVNTIFHKDDPISRLFRELETGDLVNWIAIRLSCIKQDGTPLWPEYWSIEDLLDKKKTTGISAFSTEYCNEPLADEERIICQEWIDEHRYDQLPPRNEIRFFLGVDPATGKHDGTAIVPIAVHKDTGIVYVLPSFAESCSEQKTLEQMLMLHQAYNFSLIGWEEVVFSGIYGNYIQKMGVEKNVFFPIIKLGTHGQSKEMRVRSYSMLIQNGFIRFPMRGCSNIETQLTEFPLGAFDDLCDGLWLALQAAQKSSSGKVTMSTVKRTARSVANKIIGRVR